MRDLRIALFRSYVMHRMSFAAFAALLLAPTIAAADDEPILVLGRRDAVQESRPVTIETLSGDEIARTTNVINPEDALRYAPNIFVRKRHVGDTQAPITTRTSGVGSSARSLIYADGVLLSALIGNNNSSASPKWGMVPAESIASIDVLYGPFSAAYPGNSIGAVVEIETRAPDRFEATLEAAGSLQHFSQYDTRGDFAAGQLSATLGDRVGPFSYWASVQHTESDSQPLAYATIAQPASASASVAPLSGGVPGLNRTGAPIMILGAAGLEQQTQDNSTLRLAWDIVPDLRATYALGRFGNDTSASVDSYLRDANGAAVFAGGPYNIAGRAYTIPASAFSNNLYRLAETQWMQSLALERRSGAVDWRIAASIYDYDQSEQRAPSGALPAAFAGGPGSITRFDGTGWETFDAKAVWRVNARHELSAGAHLDRFELANNRYATTDWVNGAAGALQSAARGRTQTRALWLQESWRPTPSIDATLGGRWESWTARDGLNYSASPALNVAQPARADETFSPKAAIEWRFATGWRARAALGAAYRFPTVSELYQAITTGATLTSPNPNLRPEEGFSTEWSLERRFDHGRIRLTLFTEDIDDALISQSAPLLPGSSQIFSFVQNVDHTRTRGLEMVGERDDVLIRGLSISGALTYADPRITRDNVFPAAEGKQIPQVPRWRATFVVTYRPDARWSFTLAGRASSRVYATIDNSDILTHVYQGFDDYLVFDMRAHLALDAHWSLSAGVENIGAEDYFLFHPFPQRTVNAALTYRF